jgi:UDP-glucose 4-epimerase
MLLKIKAFHFFHTSNIKLFTTFGIMHAEKYILITGGMGFIGSHTAIELIQSGYTPIIVDDLRNSSSIVLAGIKEITGVLPLFIQTACQDEVALDAVFKQYDIEGVIHFAADKAVGESVQNPLKYYSNNIESLLSLLRVMEGNSVYNLVFSSSCTVYGTPKNEIVAEKDTSTNYASPYGHSKMIGEEILQGLSKRKAEWKITLLRYFNPIGAHPLGHIGELPIGVPNNLVPYLMQVANGEREFLSVFGNDYATPDGTCVRDYLHVCDLAEVHVLALKNIGSNASTNCDVFNVGTGTGTSVLELITIFKDELKVDLPYKVTERRPGDCAAMVAGVEKIGKELNWVAKYTVKDALIHAWNWEQKRNKL